MKRAPRERPRGAPISIELAHFLCRDALDSLHSALAIMEEDSNGTVALRWMDARSEAATSLGARSAQDVALFMKRASSAQHRALPPIHIYSGGVESSNGSTLYT